jgi:hypothetical protein
MKGLTDEPTGFSPASMPPLSGRGSAARHGCTLRPPRRSNSGWGSSVPVPAAAARARVDPKINKSRLYGDAGEPIRGTFQC